MDAHVVGPSYSVLMKCSYLIACVGKCGWLFSLHDAGDTAQIKKHTKFSLQSNQTAAGIVW